MLQLIFYSSTNSQFLLCSSGNYTKFGRESHNLSTDHTPTLSHFLGVNSIFVQKSIFPRAMLPFARPTEWRWAAQTVILPIDSVERHQKIFQLCHFIKFHFLSKKNRALKRAIFCPSTKAAPLVKKTAVVAQKIGQAAPAPEPSHNDIIAPSLQDGRAIQNGQPDRSDPAEIFFQKDLSTSTKSNSLG